MQGKFLPESLSLRVLAACNTRHSPTTCPFGAEETIVNASEEQERGPIIGGHPSDRGNPTSIGGSRLGYRSLDLRFRTKAVRKEENVGAKERGVEQHVSLLNG